MFKGVIRFALDNAEELCFSEEFEELEEVFDFLNTTTRHLVNEYQSPFSMSRTIYFGSRLTSTFKSTCFRHNTGDWERYSLWNLCIPPQTDIHYFDNQAELSSVMQGPYRNTDNMIYSLCSGLEPDFVSIPNLNKTRKLRKYFNTELEPVWAEKAEYKLLPQKIYESDLNFDAEHINTYLLEVLFYLYMDIFEKAACIQTNSKTANQPFVIIKSEQERKELKVIGGIRKSDEKEFAKQYRNACIQIVKGFESGWLKTNSADVYGWVEETKELIKKENILEQQ